MSKYDAYSGKIVQTITPFGLLVKLIIEDKCTFYLQKFGNVIEYSSDKIFWFELNKGLGERLLKMSNYCNNIIVIEKEKKENEEKD